MGMMIADSNYNLVYMNHSLAALMKQKGVDLRKDLPHFDVSTIIGKNTDVFHKNPAYQYGMLDKLTTKHETTIQIGSTIFYLVVNPVLNAKRECLGMAVEWKDITQERAIEEEINIIVQSCIVGDFTIFCVSSTVMKSAHQLSQLKINP